MKTLTNGLVTLVKKYLPSPFSLAIVLTIIVFIFGFTTTEHSAHNMITYWSAGTFSNLAFIFQMIMILFAGYALAISPVVSKMIDKLAGIPKNRTSALLFTFSVSYICGYINWGFGLVAAAIIAKKVAEKGHGKKYDFPIMVAAAYAATQVAALSSAVPLQLATAGHFLEELTGVIPLSKTLFAGWNIALTIVIWAAVMVTLKIINPKEADAIEVDIKLLREEKKEAEKPKKSRKDMTFAEKLDSFPLLSMFIVFLAIYNVVVFFVDNSFLNMDTNTVITIFLALGILAHKRPNAYMAAVNEAIKTCGGIALLFPLYYGLMGMMRSSGMATSMSEWFVSISTPNTYNMFTFWSASLVNMFIPSGGGQWAVQGPVMIPGALALGLDPAKTAMAVCWGDLCTNLIQPFWAIPVLSIAKLDVKDIMGYCALLGIIEFIIISLFFLF